MRPYIGAPIAAALADETWFQIRKPDTVRPLVDHGRLKLDRMAALVVGAVDQQATSAGLPHFAQGDLLLPHPP